MQTLILAYTGCILFEVIRAASFLDPVLAVKVATPDGDCVRDRSGVTVVPDFAYNEVKPGTISCLLVPGGNPDTIAENAQAKQIVRDILAGGGVVAGLCAGVVVLALAGVLRGRRVHLVDVPARPELPDGGDAPPWSSGSETARRRSRPDSGG